MEERKEKSVKPPTHDGPVNKDTRIHKDTPKTSELWQPSEFHIRSTDVLQHPPAGAQIDPFLSLQLKVGFFCQMQTGSKLNSQTSVVSLRDSGNFGDSDIYLIVFTVFSSSLISFTGLILSDIDRLI